MQNKKSVVFIVPESMFLKAVSIRRELIGDPRYAGVVIAEKSLRCLIKNTVFDKIFPENSSLRDLYKKMKEKRFKRKSEYATYGDSCGLPQKTVRNLFYRFVPDIVIVSTEEALRSVIAERKKTGIDSDIGVLCRETITKEMVEEEVDFYFVDDIPDKNKLLEMNVPAEKIIPASAALMGEIVEEEKRTRAKENLDLIEKKVVLFAVERCTGVAKERIAELMTTPHENTEYLFWCGEDGTAAEYISGIGGRVVGRQNELENLIAADVVFSFRQENIPVMQEANRTPIYIKTDRKLLDAVEEALVEKGKVVPAPPHAFFADYLKQRLDQKVSIQAMEKEELQWEETKEEE